MPVNLSSLSRGEKAIFRNASSRYAKEIKKRSMLQRAADEYKQLKPDRSGLSGGPSFDSLQDVYSQRTQASTTVGSLSMPDRTVIAGGKYYHGTSPAYNNTAEQWIRAKNREAWNTVFSPSPKQNSTMASNAPVKRKFAKRKTNPKALAPGIAPADVANDAYESLGMKRAEKAMRDAGRAVHGVEAAPRIRDFASPSVADEVGMLMAADAMGKAGKDMRMASIMPIRKRVRAARAADVANDAYEAAGMERMRRKLQSESAIFNGIEPEIIEPSVTMKSETGTRSINRTRTLRRGRAA